MPPVRSMRCTAYLMACNCWTPVAVTSGLYFREKPGHGNFSRTSPRTSSSPNTTPHMIAANPSRKSHPLKENSLHSSTTAKLWTEVGRAMAGALMKVVRPTHFPSERGPPALRDPQAAETAQTTPTPTPSCSPLSSLYTDDCKKKLNFKHDQICGAPNKYSHFQNVGIYIYIYFL